MEDRDATLYFAFHFCLWCSWMGVDVLDYALMHCWYREFGGHAAQLLLGITTLCEGWQAKLIQISILWDLRRYWPREIPKLKVRFDLCTCEISASSELRIWKTLNLACAQSLCDKWLIFTFTLFSLLVDQRCWSHVRTSDFTDGLWDMMSWKSAKKQSPVPFSHEQR